MTQRNSINWTNTLFLTLTPIIGIVGTILLCVFSIVHWQTWVLFGAMFVLTGLSVTAGYHRLFSHRSYKTVWPIRLILILFGSGAFEGSVFEWSTDHRDHHRFTDTDQDPYNVKKGFWYAHLGWLLRLDTKKRHFSNIDDLKESRLLRFQHRYYVAIATVMGFVVPTAIASLWGDPFGGLIVAGALRITASHHSTFCINSLCHILGKRTYSDSSSARDNWLSALVTFGEGYHNYHHRFPVDYRNGIRFYHFDPTKWLIRGLSYLGLATELRRIPRYRIIQVMIESQERIAQDNAKHGVLTSLHESIMKTLEKVREFELAYAKSRTKEYRLKLKHAKNELQDLLYAWKRFSKPGMANF